MNKQTLLQKYVALARKLGKLPSLRETRKFVCSERQVINHYDTLAKLKATALKEYPELAELEVPAKLVEADLEVYRLDLEKQNVKRKNKKLIENVSTFDYISKFSDAVFSGRVKATPPKNNHPNSRTITLMLSDLHIGADIDGKETGTGVSFGRLEESRRLAAVIREAIDYKPQYRSQSRLVVALLGDIIENNMHDPRTGDLLSIQICRAIHLLIQAIAKLASSYPEVVVECATGNHDRNTSRHHGRAVHGKYDSHSTVIYYAIKAAMKNVPNVTVNIPKSPMSSYEVYGQRIGYTHSDTVLKTGGVYSTVNVKGLEAQINKLNAGLPDQSEYVAMLYGHTHIGHLIHLSNGCTLLGNGALPPPDSFAVSIGSAESNNGQWIFESVPGYAVGDVRFIRCGKNYDQDESLDDLIKPWDGL
jgi:hypothetical protein